MKTPAYQWLSRDVRVFLYVDFGQRTQALTQRNLLIVVL